MLRLSPGVVTLLASTALLVSSGVICSPQNAPAASPTAVPAPGDDGGWPKTYRLSDGGSATIYQPQVTGWPAQKHIVALAAVSCMAAGAKTPSMGTVKIEGDTSVSLPERLVGLESVTITELKFPGLSRSQAKTVSAALQKSLPNKRLVISLDRVLANLDRSKTTGGPATKADIKADPPRIFHLEVPAILVLFDGEPIWSPIQGLDLKFAVNTNWDVFQEVSSGTCLLRYDKLWMKAGSVNGPWEPAGELPADLGKLPADDNWKEVKASLSGRPGSGKPAPEVLVSTEQAELLLLKGAPRYEPVKGGTLLWVKNTDSDLFRDGQDGPFYYLVAGRWFSAESLDGPWQFATPNLPPSFKAIPQNHPRARVLASVPGTDQAWEAVVLSQVPQTARVNRTQLKAPAVTYADGVPNFTTIPGTTVLRATNTDKDVLKVGELFYLCYQGVWFQSQGPEGPWQVATTVPAAIYTIPASSPAYSVTYVTVVQDPDPDWVVCSYTAGYVGAMVMWGCCVWGTGWYYPPFHYGGIYYPYPHTWGVGAWYNPATGGYGRGAAVYGPYGGVAAAASYNPVTGTYARGAAAYGPYGAGGFVQAYNPRTGNYAQTRQGASVYGHWGTSTAVKPGGGWVQTAHRTNYLTGRSVQGARGSGGGSMVHVGGPGGSTTVGRTGGGDLYAGHDGNIYRRQDGQWQQYGDGGWTSTAQPHPQTASQLSRDASARSRGQQRVTANSTSRSGSFSRPSTSGYRSSGGGGRRGGRRR